jgi:hypothetical protein
VTIRGRAARLLIGVGLSGCAILALASVLVLHGGVLDCVDVLAALTGVLTYFCREQRGAQAVATAWKAAAGAVAIIMIVTGAGVVGGGVLVALVVGAALVAGGVGPLLRVRQERRSAGHRPAAAAPGATVDVSVRLTGLLEVSPPPVSLLPTVALGREWVRTSEALQTRLEPAAQQVVVRRRQDVLDELERRDPAGFARWLIAAPHGNDDPAAFVQADRLRGSDTA